MPVKVTPGQEPTFLDTLLGDPQQALQWGLILLLVKAGWNWVDTIIPVRWKQALILQQQQQGRP